MSALVVDLIWRDAARAMKQRGRWQEVARAWAALALAKRAATLEAAKGYVLGGDPRNDEWFATRGWPFGAVAGHEALLHLDQFEPEFLEGLTADRWSVWIPVLMTYFKDENKESADK